MNRTQYTQHILMFVGRVEGRVPKYATSQILLSHKGFFNECLMNITQIFTTNTRKCLTLIGYSLSFRVSLLHQTTVYKSSRSTRFIAQKQRVYIIHVQVHFLLDRLAERAASPSRQPLEYTILGGCNYFSRITRFGSSTKYTTATTRN